jgi:hypothetical protein
VAAVRSGPMAVGGIPHLGVKTDLEPRTARHGFAQALGAPEAPRPGAPGHRGVQKTYGPPRLQAISRSCLFSLRQRIRSQGRALAKMEIRAFRSS